VEAASGLGLTGDNMYYYDLEAYDTGNNRCRNAVKAFISGWVEQLRNETGTVAGAYGSACGSMVADWASIDYPPNAVFVAQEQHPRDKDVWGLSCLSDDLFSSGHQRLHQWNLDVKRRYGGIKMKIDEDCAYGLVTPDERPDDTDPACTTE
jgi:hypothetical protein